MPETRHNTIMSYPQDIPASEKTVANAGASGWITQIPDEVSDEELAEEAEQATCEEYLGHSPDVITPPEIWHLLRAFGKKLGYTIEKD